MKIKTKKKLNLPQLIEWAWENHIRNKGFESERTSRAYFDYDGYLNCTRAMEPNDTFTVEVEEEITEDTVIPKLVEIYKDFLGGTEILKHEYKSINKVKDEKALYFYILNDDLTMTLIWREGKLVE
ncbi:hypothetical protein [Staphylococcus succinus]|uniref:hypothetical protein n=1 Tax=Staphylococcus succinus TaxID=61015 RepID=UPI00301BD8F1